MNELAGKKIFVGVSGGVDSSVSLALLKNAGADVTGVFLKVWNPDFLPCNWREERRSAMRVCATLNVPFLTLDFEKEYKKEVVNYMINEYRSGRVPNPDIFCNKFIKFGTFLKKARELGADFIATGHYAIVERRVEKSGYEYTLKEGIDKEKDQSYFLYTLGQNELKHVLFPVGNLEKKEVRVLAKKFLLPTAEKKDSQGLCFIGKIDLKDFLSHYISLSKGNVLNTKGQVIGEHDGAFLYTIGERHGFEINKKGPNHRKMFVLEKDVDNNTITVGEKVADENLSFKTKSIFLKNIHFISGKTPDLPLSSEVRIRYRQKKEKCLIKKVNDGYEVSFDNSQDGVAIGQSAVFYSGDECIGGGIIEKTA